MILALGISHVDLPQAEKWLRHVAMLSRKETSAPRPLVVMRTKRVHPNMVALWRERIEPIRFPVQWVECPDENEDGYPKSASHLFLRTMAHCEGAFPGEPVLWVEADTVAMRPGWHDEIAAEYAGCGKPFMGVIVRGHGFDHLSGVSVYPPDWRAKAPLLADTLNAPDIFWGVNRGQAFDTYATPQTLPQAADAKTIQQIWRPQLPIKTEWLNHIRRETALFHQCKDGSLFEIVQKAYA